MITKITGEQPFQVLTNNFSISPSQEGYTLQISADGKQYSNLFSVGAGVTRLVTGVAANSYYRLLGNQSKVSINWMKTCVTEGGSGSGTELTPVAEFPLGAEAGTVVAYNGTASASGVYQYTGEEWVPVGVDDLSAYWTSAQTQSAITAVEDHLFDVEEVTASALTELHTGLLEVSARTQPDMSLYTPTSGFSTINGSAITNGGNLVIQGGGSSVVELTQAEYDALSAYSEDTTYIITDASAITMDDYATLSATSAMVSSAMATKADKASIQGNNQSYYSQVWYNEQGIITGDSQFNVYSVSINDWNSAAWLDPYGYGTPGNCYFPTTSGVTGQVLQANDDGNGNKTPVWSPYKFVFIYQTAYDALVTKDASAIYFIIGQ